LSLVFTFGPQIRGPNFSQIGARIRELQWFLQSVRNDEEEKEEKTRNFYENWLTHISGTA